MEKEMGRQRVVDKTVRPLTTLSSITPADATGGVNINQLGNLPIGNYKGVPAFWDLDKAVNQPLILAEMHHILGIIAGREEDYDLQTLGIVAAEAIGTAHTANLTIPTGEVWFLNSVQTTIPASGGANIITANWYCSLWTDRVGALGFGQPFHAANMNTLPGDPGAAGGVWQDEFQPAGPVWQVTSKSVPLRLPAGTIITVQFINTTALAAAAVNATFQLFGWIGRTLVA